MGAALRATREMEWQIGSALADLHREMSRETPDLVVVGRGTAQIGASVASLLQVQLMALEEAEKSQLALGKVIFMAGLGWGVAIALALVLVTCAVLM